MKNILLNATLFTLASVIYMAPSFAEKNNGKDKVILSFSTAGDSRQDPANPTQALCKQDK